MAFLDTVKGWFNIGGVKVKLEGVDPVVAKDGNKITAKVKLSSKSDKDVTKATYQLIEKTTTGTGNERRTRENVLAERVVAEPFQIKAGEDKTLDFNLDYALAKSLKDMGGVLGGLGKIAAFASSERDTYFVVASVGVKGAAFNPSDRVQVTLK